jgi:hypothetical protein
MTMFGKTVFLVLGVTGALALAACSTGSGEEGSGTEGSEARELPPFTAVEVSGRRRRSDWRSAQGDSERRQQPA